MLDVNQVAFFENLIKKGIKHKDIKRVTELADDYYSYMTGLGLDAKLKRFNPRESTELFNQRKNLSIITSPVIIGSISKPFQKVARTTPITAKVDFPKDEASQSVEDFHAVIEQMSREFYGNDAGIDGVDYWMMNQFKELSFIDPNSWLIIQFDAYDANKEKPKPKPFIASAKEVFNFEFDNNKLKYLHIGIEIPLFNKEGKEERKGIRHVYYWGDYMIIYEETALKLEEFFQMPNPYGYNYKELDNKFYLTKVSNIKTGNVVPAFRIGYKRDMVTMGRTCVSPFHDAMLLFEKMVKDISEYDLSRSLHVFPQKIVRIGKGCPGVADQGPNGACMNGKLRDGKTCPTCNGSGRSVHTTAQDVVFVELPESVKEDGIVPLSEMVHYVDMPIELLKLQKEICDEYLPKCHQAVFNTTVLVQKGQNNQAPVTEKTAFEVDNDMESVHDTLHPFAERFSAAWIFINRMFVTLADIKNSDLTKVIHRMPSKYQLKSLDKLYSEYKTATDSSLPSFIIEAITDDLAQTLYMDDASNLIRYRVKKNHFPFAGKTKNEITLLLSSSEVLRETKVLYNYFDRVFLELEIEFQKNNLSFYELKYVEQKAKIDEKVNEIIKQLETQQPKAIPF